MQFRLLLLSAALTLSLAACDDPALMGTGTAAPAVTASAFDPATIYAARTDGSFAVPALPVDEIPEEFRRQIVDYPTDQAPGTIIINPAERHLYLIMPRGKALRFGIAVGRAGFLWSGEAQIEGRKLWPDWHPPPEMIARRPELEK